MNKINLCILLIILSVFGCSQKNEYYHRFETTDSKSILVKDWNVADTVSNYIIETTDDSGRVCSLKIVFKNDPYYFNSWEIVKYHYIGSERILATMIYPTEESNFSHIDTSYNLYFLSNGFIDSCLYYNSSNRVLEKIEMKYICCFDFSFHFMNGTFPCTRGFSPDQYYFEEDVRERILKGMPKL